MQRQLLRLLSALDRDGVNVPDPSSYRVLQYNPPYTLPWLRRNELLVAVRGGVPGEGLVEGVGAEVRGAVEDVKDVMDSAARAFDDDDEEEGSQDEKAAEGDEDSQPSDY